MTKFDSVFNAICTKLKCEKRLNDFFAQPFAYYQYFFQSGFKNLMRASM